MSLRRIAVRSSSDSRPQARPPRMTSPASGRSSRPAVCSSVDLPAPDGATSATISPRLQREIGAVQDGQLARALDVVALDALQFDDASRVHSYRSASTGSSLAARQAGNSVARKDSTSAIRTTETVSLDIHLGRQLAQEIELGIEQHGARQPGEELRGCASTLRQTTTPSSDAGERAGDADRRARHQEDAHHRAARRAHGAQDGDVAALVLHQHDQAGDDVERGDQHDQRQDHEHDVALDLQRREEGLVALPPVGDEDLAARRYLDGWRSASTASGLSTKISIVCARPSRLK